MILQAAIPVTILSGFLGAGKTTLLNHLLHADHGLRIAVLVNDFGAINIDAQLVVGVQEDDTINLANGCICCTIRGDLLKAALKLVDRPQPPEYIIIEPSGVSDPVSVAQTFLLPELRSRINLDSIVTIVDAEQLKSLSGSNAYLAYEQLAVADIIIVNKTDLVSADELRSLRKNWLYPQARVLETSYGRVAPELILGVGSYSPERLAVHTNRDVHIHEASAGPDHERDHDHDHSIVFNAWSWTSDQPLSLKAVRRATKSLPPSIFRLKGVLYLADEPERRTILQMVGTRITLTVGDAWGSQKPGTQLVAIGTPGGVNARELDGRFDSCVQARQPINIAEQIMSSVIGWFRG